MKKKRYILLLLMGLILGACSVQQEDEIQVTDMVEDFYKSINRHDFKDTEMLCSENMKQSLKKLKDDAAFFTQYKRFAVTDVEVSNDRGAVTVESTDVFGNTVTNVWDVIKEKNSWKINNFNLTKTADVEDNTLKNDSVKKDTLYN